MGTEVTVRGGPVGLARQWPQRGVVEDGIKGGQVIHARELHVSHAKMSGGHATTQGTGFN